MIAGIIVGGIGILAFLFMAALGVAYFIFWLCMLIHAIRNKGLSDGEKIVWVLVLVFLHVLGPLLYFFIARPKSLG